MVGGFQHRLAADRRWVGLKATIVQLPARQAGCISGSVHGEAASATTYVFAQPDAWYRLECFAQAIPAPDWRSIAATVDFLPAETWVSAAERVAAPTDRRAR